METADGLNESMGHASLRFSKLPTSLFELEASLRWYRNFDPTSFASASAYVKTSADMPEVKQDDGTRRPGTTGITGGFSGKAPGNRYICRLPPGSAQALCID